MTRGVCDPAEVQRFLTRFPKSHTLTQLMYDELMLLYSKGNVTYDEKGPATKFNLRYHTHPMTNLSELNAADYLHRTLSSDYTVELVEDIPDQVRGHDLYIIRNGVVECTVSVKLSYIDPRPDHRSFTISYHVKRELLKQDESDMVIFVDNINQLALLVDMKLIPNAMHAAQPVANNPHRVMVFYDLFGGTHESLVRSICDEGERK